MSAASPGAAGPGPSIRSERTRLGLPERYLVYSGRYDARQDLATLLRALESMAAAGRPGGLAGDVAWPPRVLLVGTTPEDRTALARAAGRVDVGESLAYAPQLPDDRLANLVRGGAKVINASDLNTFDILNAENLILAESSVKVIETILNK